MINTVIFDIGNVLVDFDWEGYTNKLFPGQPALIERINYAVWGDGRWDRLDWGEEPEKVFASIIAAAPECESELRQVFVNVGDTLRKRDTTESWLKDLQSRGIKIFYLSNYSHYCMNAKPEVLDFLPMMDGGVFSCDVHLLKPQREIYQYITDKYNLVPSECVFIDDLAKNVDGAKNFGFHAIQCVTVEQTQRDLNNLLAGRE